MDLDLFSFKELYDVTLKLTYPLEINGEYYEENEVVARFDELQIAFLDEETSHISASGGYGNRDHVFWDTTKDIRINFSKGVFSKTQFGLMTNSKVMQIEKDSPIIISRQEVLESNELNIIKLKYPFSGSIFIYDKETGKKIQYKIFDSQTIDILKPFKEVVVNYDYEYSNGGSVIIIGNKLLSGFLQFEGKTRVKDDTTGKVVTGILKIPKLKLMSDLSIRLGTQAGPVVGNFSAKGVPTGSRSESYVTEFYFLNNDIDSDF